MTDSRATPEALDCVRSLIPAPDRALLETWAVHGVPHHLATRDNAARTIRYAVEALQAMAAMVDDLNEVRS